MKKLSTTALTALNRALAAIFWYKNELRRFLEITLTKPEILSKLDWTEAKRDIVGRLTTIMVRNEDVYQDDLLTLIREVSAFSDFSHLRDLDDGPKRVRAAQEAVKSLREMSLVHEELESERKEREERRKEALERQRQESVVRQELAGLKQTYQEMLGQDPQRRGFLLEKVINQLFELFDLDPKASFKIAGEQIDGAFTFDGTDYLFEGKWQRDPVGATDLYSLEGKLGRKLDNTLGLFLAVNGFSDDGISAHSSGKKYILLMDGSDLWAVLDGRVDLPKMLLRKRQHASQTGNIYLRMFEDL